MRATFRRLAPLALALFAVLGTTLPAAAKSQLLHWKFQRALASNPLDSTLVTLSTTSFDTLDYIPSDNINATAVAAIDTNLTGQLAAVAHTPKNLALVVEVTGALQSQDSIYVGFQFSQGATPPPVTANGGSGDQSNSYNWRWYNAALTSAGGTVENATGTQTFIFPMPCTPGSANAWVWAKAWRWIIQGDTNAAAKAFSTRAWLVTRD
jgi:hypothetical protein